MLADIRRMILFFGLLSLSLSAASITGISPPLGHPGDVVRINGSGFDTTTSNNLARFGPNRAPVLAATPSQLTVQVPNGQPLGPSIVTVNGSGSARFNTVAGSKIEVPPNYVAECHGCTCQSCGCQDPYTSPCVSQGAFLGDGVYGERGEFFHTATDLSIPGRPGAGFLLQFSVQRQYRSDAVNNGPLGNKWDHNYFENLAVQVDGSVMHHNGLGRNDRYLLNNQGNFVAPPEFYTTLARNTDGSYALTYKDRMVKQFDTTGKIQQISDRNGNSLRFSYNVQGQLTTVGDTLGRPITYSYDGAGRLQQITDFIGRTVTYTYNANGDLASVTTPAVTGTPNGNDFPVGKTTRFTYDSAHNLLTITRPNEAASGGPAVLQNTYDGSGRIVSQIYGGTNASGVSAGGTYTFTYTPSNSGVTSDDPNLPAMRTQQTDRNGNVTQYDYNRLGYPVAIRKFTRGLRPGDPPVYVTSMTYNADGRLLQKVMPQGNTIQYTYDEGKPDRLQSGNMLQETRLPDASRGGDQQFVTKTYTYEPSFNHILTMTDPRGNDLSFVPPNGGSPSAARYTTTFTYDSSGNLARKQQPTVTLPNNTLQQIFTDYTYNQFGQLTSETDPEGNVTQYAYFPNGGYLQQKVVDATTSPRRTETTSPAQITTQYFYDAVGNTTRIIDPRGNDTLYTFNQLNQIVRAQSEAPFRYITDTFYDANDNIVRRDVEDKVAAESDGKPNFTGDGNFTTQSGAPPFFVNRYTYDILDKPVKQDLDATGSTPSRLVTQYRYDANQNRTSEIYPEGNIRDSQYDERNLLFKQTRGAGTPDASTTTFNYDLNRNLATTIDGRAFQANYQYDGFDRRTTTIDPVGGRGISHYDPASNVVTRSTLGQPGGPSPTDNSGAGNVLLNRQTIEYDELNRAYQRDQLPVNSTSFIAAGVSTLRPASVTPGPLCPGAICTQTIHDRNGRAVQQIQDDLATISTQYDGVNRPVLITDPQANTTRYSYDANSNVTQTIVMDVSQKSGVASETFNTSYQYDSRNRKTSASDNCRNTRRSAYDSRNNLTHMTDAKFDNTLGCAGSQNLQGNSMRYAYDGLNRRLQTVQDLRAGGIGLGVIDITNPFNADGRTTATLTYDGNSRLLSVTDDNGNTTRYTYDALDRKAKETLADNTATTYTYDPDDNIVTLTDNNGSVQTHTYDRINRRTQSSVTPAPGVLGTTLNQFQYDGLSRMTRMTDNNDPSDPNSASTVTFAYDSLSRLVEGTQNGRAVDSAWFAQAQRASLTYPNGRQVNYTYDTLERIQTIQDATAPTSIALYTYIGRTRVLQRPYQNGTRLTYLDNAGTTDIGYDPLQRTIQRRDLRSDNTLVVGFTHAYDRENNKNNELKLHSGTNTELYTYDSVSRISDFQRGQPASKTEDWTLDGVGNWRLHPVNGAPETRTVNTTNEYTTINSNNLTYDRNGNLTRGLNLGYQWDYKNRLRQVCSLPANTTSCTSLGAVLLATYSYDAMNRRTRKVVTNSGTLNGTTNLYYDNWRTIEERNGSDALTQQYVYGIYIDEPLVLDRFPTGQRLFYHQNTQYSTFALTDSTGAVVEGYQYDAYGQQTVLAPDFTTVTGTTSTFGNPYMFSGQRFDAETGLMYFKERYYSASLGRFLSRDHKSSFDSGLHYYKARYYSPARGRVLRRDPLKDLTRINLYAYVGDKPTRLIDPSGLADDDLLRRFTELVNEWLENQGEFNEFERQQIEKELTEVGLELEKANEEEGLLELYDEVMSMGEETGTTGAVEGTGTTIGGRVAAATPAAAGGLFGAFYWWFVNKLLQNQINSIVDSTKSPSDGTGCCECECIHPDLSRPPEVRSQYFGVTEDIGRASGETECALLCIRATPLEQPLWRFHRCH